MSFEKKEVTVKIDNSLYATVEEYCAYSGETEETVVKYLLTRSLNRFNKDYEKLKKGYVEMGNINLEISDAFKASENEAMDYIEN